MPWIYEQATGRLTDPTGNQTATGYSGGNCGKNPDGVNNPSMASAHCIGPIPVGSYTLTPPCDSPATGPFTMPLIPDPENQMWGRSGFCVHGDTTPPGNASEGCVILPRSVRESMWASADHQLTVV